MRQRISRQATCPTSRVASHQPAARPPARGRPGPRRRNDGPGREGAGEKGADDELPVGPGDRQRPADPAVRLRSGSRGTARRFPLCRHQTRSGLDERRIRGLWRRRRDQRAYSSRLLGPLPPLLRRDRGADSEGGRWPGAHRHAVIAAIGALYAVESGAQASANLYSLVETCKANGVDPYPYLVSLFRNRPSPHSADDFEGLLPWRLNTAA